MAIGNLCYRIKQKQFLLVLKVCVLYPIRNLRFVPILPVLHFMYWPTMQWNFQRLLLQKPLIPKLQEITSNPPSPKQKWVSNFDYNSRVIYRSFRIYFFAHTNSFKYAKSSNCATIKISTFGLHWHVLEQLGLLWRDDIVA